MSTWACELIIRKEYSFTLLGKPLQWFLNQALRFNPLVSLRGGGNYIFFIYLCEENESTMQGMNEEQYLNCLLNLAASILFISVGAVHILTILLSTHQPTR